MIALKTKARGKKAGGRIDTTAFEISDSKAPLPFASNLGELLEHLLDTSAVNNGDKFIKKLVQELSRYTGLPQDYIYPVSGAQTMQELVCRSFVPDGRSIVMPGPSETLLIEVANKLGAEIMESFGESPFEIDREQLAEAIDSRTSLVYLTNPSRPAGAELSARDLEFILNQKGDFIVALDESEYELARMDGISFLRKYDNLLIIRTFPRLMGLASTPGGYILAKPSKLKLLEAAGHSIPKTELGETAAIAALRSVHFLKNDDSKLKDYMTLLVVRLRGLGLNCRTTPFDYILIKTDSPEKLTAYLLGQGISCRSLSHLRQLEKLVAIYINSDTAAMTTIEVFRRAPRKLLYVVDDSRPAYEFMINQNAIDKNK